MADTDTSSPMPQSDPDFASLMKADEKYRKEVEDVVAAEKQDASQITSTADADARGTIERALQFASNQQPFSEPPPHDQINQVMTGAPWLFALTAIGGKASGMNGLAMLQGLNGMSDGIIKGDQEALDNSYKNYQAEFDKWKARSDQQARIYDVLSQAYTGANDGKLRAMEAAMKITGDAREKKLALDDPDRMVQMKVKLEEAHSRVVEANAKMMEARAKAAQQQQYDARAKSLLAAIAAKGVKLPSSARSQSERLAMVQGLLERYPEGASVDQIADDLKSGKLSMDVAEIEARLAGRREAAVSSAILTLNKSDGLYDQLEGAAKQVNFGDAKFKSRLDLALQGKYVADPALQYYVTKLNEARAELAQVFTRTGQTTDQVRAMAHDALPDASSLKELQEAIRSSREAADAVASGNEAFISAVESGKSLKDALAVTKGDSKTFSSEGDAEKAAAAGKIHKGDKITVGGVSGTWQ